MKKLVLVATLATSLLFALVGPASRASASPANPTYALSGAVTGLGGAPLGGVTVEARTYAPDGSVLPVVGSTSTGADGHYSLGLVRGTYSLAFRSPDPAVAVHQQYIGIMQDTTLDVVLQPAGRITGSVVASSDLPTTITVRFLPWAPATPTLSVSLAVSSTPTTYTSPPLEPGTYNVRFDAPAGSGLASQVFGAAIPTSPATPVTVTPGAKASGIDASLPRSVSIDGVLRLASGRPVAGADVKVFGDALSQRPVVNTDANGAYSIGDLPPGTLTVSFSKNLTPVATRTISVSSGAARGVDAVVTAAVLRGRTVGPDGNPIASQIWVGAPTGGGGSAYGSAPEGEYEVFVPPGSYKVSFSGGAAPVWYHGTTQADAEVITLSASEERTLDDVPLPGGGTVRGWALGDDGQPPADAVVWAVSDDGTYSGHLGFVGTDGSFTIEHLPSGRYTLVVDIDHLFGGPTYLGGGTDLAAATRFDVAEGQTVTGLDLRLPSSTASVRVTSVNPGSVAAGATTAITLNGVGFDRLAGSDSLVRAFLPGQTAEVGGLWTALDDTHLSWDADVPADATPGAYDVYIILDLGPNSFVCRGCLTVTAPPPPPPPAVAGTIGGTVTLGTGAPVAGAVVQATPVGAAPAASDPHATTDSQGRYQLSAPPGTYAVHFDGGPTLLPEWYRNAASTAAAKPVTVKAGTAASGIDAGLAKAAAPLAVTSVNPAHLGAGQSASATVRGTGFKSHGVAGLAFAAGPGITVTITSVVNDTTANVRIAAGAAATPGQRDLVGTRDGGPSASCAGCLTVDGALPPAGTVITSISPTPVAPGFLGGLDIKGSGLDGATTATVDGIGVTVKSLTVVSPTKLRLRVAVDAAAQPGRRTLTVSLPGGQQITTAFTIG